MYRRNTFSHISHHKKIKNKITKISFGGIKSSKLILRLLKATRGIHWIFLGNKFVRKFQKKAKPHTWYIKDLSWSQLFTSFVLSPHSTTYIIKLYCFWDSWTPLNFKLWIRAIYNHLRAYPKMERKKKPQQRISKKKKEEEKECMDMIALKIWFV